MLRRGFKSWCEKAAADIRAQLGISSTEPMPAKLVAGKYGVSVISIEEIPGLSDRCIKHLTETDPASWSAATLIHPKAKLIIVNSSHSLGRQSNSIMHEMAHLICGHQAAQTEYLPDGTMMLKAYDKEQEEEADILSATLLLPRVALVSILSSHVPLEREAERFNVSIDLLNMRMKRAGVYMQFKRRQY